MNALEAVGLAAKLHAGQVDKLGEPYIGHCVRVMLRLPDDATEDEKIAALLHDAVEDALTTRGNLSASGVQRTAVAIIDALTRRRDESYDDFLARVIAAGPSAIRVKIADLSDNCDETRMAWLARIKPETAMRLADKYAGAIERLTQALSGQKAATG